MGMRGYKITGIKLDGCFSHVDMITRTTDPKQTKGIVTNEMANIYVGRCFVDCSVSKTMNVAGIPKNVMAPIIPQRAAMR